MQQKDQIAKTGIYVLFPCHQLPLGYADLFLGFMHAAKRSNSQDSGLCALSLPSVASWLCRSFLMLKDKQPEA
jgi:hypothetical protein